MAIIYNTYIDSSDKDYLNRSNIRNRDNTSFLVYNCGGWALGTFSWWRPFRKETGYQTIGEFCFFNNISDDSDILHHCAEVIENDCPHLKRVTKWNDDDTIIAFRIGILWSEEGYISDWDFHFRLKLANGLWTEKSGNNDITASLDPTKTNAPWEISPVDPLTYDSEIIYFKDTRGRKEVR